MGGIGGRGVSTMYCIMQVSMCGLYGHIYRASDITQWCDFAQLTSNRIQSHNQGK